MSDYDLKLNMDKDVDIKVSTELNFDVTVNVDVTKNIDVKLNLSELEGNAAILVADVEAIGDNSLTEVTTAILVTDTYSGITVEAAAYVGC